MGAKVDRRGACFFHPSGEESVARGRLRLT